VTFPDRVKCIKGEELKEHAMFGFPFNHVTRQVNSSLKFLKNFFKDVWTTYSHPNANVPQKLIQKVC